MAQSKQDMGSGNVRSLMLQLMIPAVVAQVVNLLYNIVDRIYIGHIAGIGAAALTGVGLFSPFLMLLIGFGSSGFADVFPGVVMIVVIPLGYGFTMPLIPSDKLLLVGGGVGTAPMLYLGEQLAKNGHKPTFLLGARRKNELNQMEEFAKYGEVNTTTEDGRNGEKGYVTQHTK